MPTYVLPQVNVFQDFQAAPAAVARPLRAHIAGGHAYLVRFAETDERSLGSLGYYDRVLDQEYSWPNRPTGAVIDDTYTKVYIRDALLQYFTDSSAGGDSITKLSGYNNRIRAATLGFADNGADYPRSASFLDRDVRAGDIAKVRGVNGDGDPVTLWTSVRDLVAEVVDAEVGTQEPDTDNADAQSADDSVEQIGGDINCVELTVDASAYDGLADGYINETYDILVLASSVDGDFTTAELRVISGSGEDDVASVTPAAAGDPTEIGTRGLEVTFDVDPSASCSESAEAEDVSAVDLIAGQRWRVTVAQDFTPSTAASGGTYTGTSTTSLVVEVTRGGTFGDATAPQISVMAADGSDLSGPTDVESAATEYDVGTQGVTITFTGTVLRAGDKYVIPVTAASEGRISTIVLANNLDTEIAAGTEMELTLFILRPELEVSENRTGFAPLVNWEGGEDEITINSGIVAYDDSWTDDGELVALDVYAEEDQEYGEVFVEYRAWRTDLCDSVETIDDTGNLGDIAGALHPDNPLKWGVYMALRNSAGVEVKYTSVCNPADADSWAEVLSLLVGRDDVYGLVPLTTDSTVLNLYAAHVASQSEPEEGLWRVVWTSLSGLPEIPLVSAGSTVPGYASATTSDGEVCLTVIEDDPDTSGTQYTRVRCPAGNSQFVTNGVRAGDTYRALYVSDGFGGTTYQEFTVAEVVSEEELLLETGPDAAVNTASRSEVWRTLTLTEEAQAIGGNAAAFGSRRVRAVWPDFAEDSGTVMAGYFVAAALAGLSSGVLPHQGLTNVEVGGLTALPRTSRFNRTQLNSMAVQGAWIVAQDPISGDIFTRHAVTTGDYEDIEQREEMITRNVDSMSYRFKELYQPYIGKTNVTEVVRGQIGLSTTQLLDLLRTENATNTLGGQLVEGALDSVERHVTLRDRYVVNVTLTVPAPVNNIDVHLAIAV